MSADNEAVVARTPGAADATVPSKPVRLGLAHGVAWQAGARWTAQILSWAATLIVARFLVPDAYGIMGMSVVVVSFTTLVTEFGIGTTIITQKDMATRLVSQLHGLSLMVGALMTILVCLIAHPVALFYNEPRVQGVLWVLSINFLLAGVSTVPISVLKRDLNYRAVSTIEFVKAVATSAAVLILAVKGAQHWALAVGNVIGSVAMVVGLARYTRVPLAVPRFAELGSTLRHSRDFLLSTLAWFAYSNADAIILGKVSGASILGQYRFGSALASLPGEKLVNVLGSVTLPVFSTIKNDTAALRALFLDVTELVSFVVFPALFMLAVLSPMAVPFVFGAKWNPAVPVVQFLCVTACFQNLSVVNGQVLRARGRSADGRKIGMIALAFFPPLFWYAARTHGATGVAVAWLLGQPLLFGMTFWLTKMELELSGRTYLSRLKIAAFGTALMTVVTLVSIRLLPAEWPATVRLPVSAAIGGLAFVALLLGPNRARVLALLKALKER